MRISLVIGNYDAFGGGAERWTDRHARRLQARGHEVHLLARRFRGAPEGTSCHIVDTGKGWRPRIRFGDCAEVLLRQLSVDVVHDMGDGWYADLFMPHHGTRRGNLKHNNRFLPPAVRRARRLASRCVPRYREFRALERRQYDPASRMLYLAVSRMIRDHMLEYCHVPEERVRVVYNGVDTDHFQPAADGPTRERLRTTMQVAPHETLLLTVAHDFRRKGVDTLLRSVAQLAHSSKPVKLVVVGNGAIGRYQATARALGCDHVVRFAGDQPNTLPYYQAADIFVLPTLYDPCSLVVLEAMAAGLPVVTTRLNGVHELMHGDREGEIVDDPSDTDELAIAMERYLDGERRATAGRAARRCAQDHSIDKMVDEHLEIYEEIACRRR